MHTDRETGAPTATHPAVAAAESCLLGMDIRTATGAVTTEQSKRLLLEDAWWRRIPWRATSRAAT